MKYSPFKFHVDRRNFGRQIDVHLYAPKDDGSTDVVTMLKVERIPPDGVDFRDAPITISNAQAQELMDGLWQVGIRPSEGSGSAGSLAATERHLKDMQRIAMGMLRLDGDVA